METHATVFGRQKKTDAVKPKYNIKLTQAPKSNTKEQPFLHRRVFGTARNPNVAERVVPESTKRKKLSLKPTLPVLTPLQRKGQAGKSIATPKPVMQERTTKPSPKKPPQVQTRPPLKEPCNISPRNSDLVQANRQTKEPSDEATVNPNIDINDPVQTTTPLKEPADKNSPNPKPTTIEPSNKLSPKTITPVQTTSPPKQPEDTTKNMEPVNKTTPNPKMVSAKPITENSPKTSASIQTSPPLKNPEDTTKTIELSNKTTPSPKMVSTNPSTEPSPKTLAPVKTTNPAQEETHKTVSLTKPKKKKSVTFSQGNEKISTVGATAQEDGTKTPRPKTKRRVSGTPYYTAKRCSKCRFDMMETSAYWLTLIKLAENVGKHFLSAGFFKLALEAKAEPSLMAELEQYVLRHEYLATDPQWKDVTASYCLNIAQNYQVDNAGENGSDIDQANGGFIEQIAN